MDRTACTQLVAPGWDVVTTKIGGGKTEGWAGTSVSSPHAAAVAALLAGRCLSPDQVLEIMKSTGRTISDGCPTDAHQVTVIDAFTAVSLAEAAYPLCTDCNRNSVPDEEDLLSGASADCNSNTVPDECEGGCNRNGIPDSCDIASGASHECDGNGAPDECDVLPRDFALSPPLAVNARATVTDLAVGGIDGNSNVDLSVSSSNPNGFSVLFARAEGSFLEPVVIPTAETPTSIVVADFNRDGLLDIAAAVSGTPFQPGNSVLVVTTGPGRTFSEPRAIQVGSMPRDVIAADLDSDGDLDLATINERSADISVLRNLGNAEFLDAASIAAGASPAFLEAADRDGDGDTDFIEASRNSRELSLHADDGMGIFAAALSIGLGLPRCSSEPWILTVTDGPMSSPATSRPARSRSFSGKRMAR